MGWEDLLRNKYGIASPIAAPTEAELLEEHWERRFANGDSWRSEEAARNDEILFQ